MGRSRVARALELMSLRSCCRDCVCVWNVCGLIVKESCLILVFLPSLRVTKCSGWGRTAGQKRSQVSSESRCPHLQFSKGRKLKEVVLRGKIGDIRNPASKEKGQWFTCQGQRGLAWAQEASEGRRRGAKAAPEVRLGPLGLQSPSRR